MTASTSTSELILAAARRVVIQTGTSQLTLSAVAVEAGVSRPTLYRWFPSKELLLASLAGYEVARFDAGIAVVVGRRRTARTRLDAALRFIVGYLDDNANAIQANPSFALQSLGDSLEPHIESVARLLDEDLDEVPAVRDGALTRPQTVEMFLRLAYSHYLVPHRDTEELLTILRGFAGLSVRLNQDRCTALFPGRSRDRAGQGISG
jgi:AcrR family transcriptional regulator